MRKVASGIYTDDLTTPLEDITRRHRIEIIADLYPGAVISHRSALDNNDVSPGGKLNITSADTAVSTRELPGMSIRIWRGPSAHPTDIPLTFGDQPPLFASSWPRAILENMQLTRARSGEAKTLSEEEMERWLEENIRRLGVAWLDQMRTQAAELAAHFGWAREHEDFVGLADAIEGKPSKIRLITDVARSRSRGLPYDPERVTLFRLLHARLAQENFVELAKTPAREFENRAFWEAYFSNFIEGTKFSVGEAEAIIYGGPSAKKLVAERPEDAHDVKETYRLIVDTKINAELPRSVVHFKELLKRRHARMMATRSFVEPGVFKQKKNEFGSRIFVAPELVEETLSLGWPASRSLQSAAARALYMLFFIAEVHPFNDGNGRISRLCMNAEMEAAGQARLVLPTSLRGDYLGVLEALTERGDLGPFVKFGHKLIDLNSRMPFGSLVESHKYFRDTGALDEKSAVLNLGELMT